MLVQDPPLSFSSIPALSTTIMSKRKGERKEREMRENREKEEEG